MSATVYAPAPPAPPGPLALITGFPRLLARGLVQRGLNAQPNLTVALLHRPEDAAEANALLASLGAEDAARVVLVAGKLGDLDLGLPGPWAQWLLSHATHLFHAGAQTSGPSAVVMRHNLEGFGALAQLAGDCPNLRRLVVFSTAFVSGDRTGEIAEEELDQGQTLRSPFERSMFAVEQVARSLMPRLPITVLRPGAMIGHSRTGDASGLTEGPNYLVRLMVRLPAEMPVLLPGSGVVPFNIVPIDYVVQAAWALALKPEAEGRTFHLTDPNPVSARQAFELLGDFANRPAPFTGRWPMLMLRRGLRMAGLGRLAPGQMTLLDDLTRHVTYQCGGALSLLADTGIVCPPFEAYADTLVSWVAAYERRRREGPSAPEAA